MPGTDFLSTIIESKRKRLSEACVKVSPERLREKAHGVRRGREPHALRVALERRSARPNIIAEIKRASPSKGDIRAGAEPEKLARIFQQGGAAAISVLTEEDYFHGTLDDLRAVRRSVALPVLRKDFIISEFQIYEAAEAGADALLLIAAALEDERLARLLRITEDEFDMDALVEVHTAEEMSRAGHCGATIIGVNNRDLHTFDVSLEVSIELAGSAPRGAILVSESGLRESRDIERLRALGYKGFLIGETLMRAPRPEELLRALLNGSEREK